MFYNTVSGNVDTVIDKILYLPVCEFNVVGLRSWTSPSGRAFDQAKDKKTNRVAYHVALRYRTFYIWLRFNLY